MIKNLPKLYRKDDWVNMIYNSVAEQFTTFNELNKSNLDNINFNTLDERGCLLYEKDLQLSSVGTLSDRRNNIQSKWLSNYKCNVQSLQQLADSYYNGLLNVSYEGNATIIYTVLVGLNYFETDFTDFLNNVEIIKPAHFDYVFRYNYNKWEDYYNYITWGTERDNCNTWGVRKDNDITWSKVNASKAHIKWDYCLTRTWSAHLAERIGYDGN